ncbi:MAG TPA: hypothetical protein VFZ79_09220 [Acidimicrobiales bacterium]
MGPAVLLTAGFALPACAGADGLFGESTPEPTGAVLIVLADLTPSGRAAVESQRRHVEDVVVPLARAHRAEVVLTTIDDAALDDPGIRRVSFDTAAAAGNPVVAADIETAATTDLLAALDAVFAAGSTARTSDVAGAVGWAAATLGQSGDGWHGLVVLSDAVSTAAPCNLMLAPTSATEATVDACFPAGVPDLAAVEVFFLGASTYPQGEEPLVDPAALEGFWRTVVERGGGSVGAFGPTVLGQRPAGGEVDDV